MLAVYILLGLLALLLLLLLLLLFVPVFFRITYREQELRIRAFLLGVPLTLCPRPAKKEKASANTVCKKKTASEKEEKPSLSDELSRAFCEDGIGAAVSYLRQLASLADKAGGRLLRAITVSRLDARLVVAGDDAATIATDYGKLCGVVYPALTLIESRVRIRQRTVRLEPDFMSEKGYARVYIKLHIRVYQLLTAALGLIFGYMSLNETAKKEENTDKEAANNG